MDHGTPTRTNGTAPPPTEGAPAPPLFPAIQHARQRALLVAYAHSLQVSKACQHAGVSRPWHYHWLKHDPTYAAAFAEAQQLGTTWLEDVAIERATTGDKPSDVLLIFLLKGAKPEKYRDSARRDDRSDVSELLKAVLLELAERSQARDVTPEAEWAPVPPAERPTSGVRPGLPAPPDVEEEAG